MNPPFAYRVLLAALLASPVMPALAHGNAQHGGTTAATPISAEENAFGRQGDPRKVTRTIRIDMRDTMRFGPSAIRIKQGETIRFVVSNSGKVMHEMVLGTMAELKAHGELMKKNPGMEHEEPYMAHVGPGKKEDIVWQFTQPGEFHYACLVAGHFEAGMIGRIDVVPAIASK